MSNSFRCTKLPSQPIMSKEKCMARGQRPELFDNCIGCPLTVYRKAIILNSNQEETVVSLPRRVKRIKRY